MRGVLPKVLWFVGGFLLATAALALFYVPGQVSRVPLNVDSTTRLSGEATLSGKTSPMRITSITRTDSELSTDDVALWQNATCAVKDPDGTTPDCVDPADPEGRFISASTDTFATDRNTGVATNDFKGLPPDATPHEGLVNKFPFNTQKKSYAFFDSNMGTTVPANFSGEEKIDGLNTYKFVLQARDGDIEITEGMPGKYDLDKTYWVEPYTGSIIKHEEHQVRKMVDSGEPVVDLKMAYTPDQVALNVKDGKANSGKIALLTSTVPLVAGLLGLIAIAGAAALTLRGSSRPSAEEQEIERVLAEDESRRAAQA